VTITTRVSQLKPGNQGLQGLEQPPPKAPPHFQGIAMNDLGHRRLPRCESTIDTRLTPSKSGGLAVVGRVNLFTDSVAWDKEPTHPRPLPDEGDRASKRGDPIQKWNRRKRFWHVSPAQRAFAKLTPAQPVRSSAEDQRLCVRLADTAQRVAGNLCDRHPYVPTKEFPRSRNGIRPCASVRASKRSAA
jgi:hypothetical protein